MNLADIPYKFQYVWGENAVAGFVTTPIPATTAAPAASQSLGFPPETSEPIAAGGTPPNINDYNGAYQYTTSWLQWYQAGGQIAYDATLQTNIGGYPSKSRVRAASGLYDWQSTVDANVTNPDAAGAGWQAMKSYVQISRTVITGQTFQNIALPTGYERFRVHIQNGLVSNAGSALAMRLSNNGGVSFLSSANYTYVVNGIIANTGASFTANSIIGTLILLSTLLPANNVAGPWDTTLELWPGSASAAPRVYGNFVGVDSLIEAVTGIVGGSWGSTTGLMDYMQILTGAGTLSAVVILEGLPA